MRTKEVSSALPRAKTKGAEKPRKLAAKKAQKTPARDPAPRNKVALSSSVSEKRSKPDDKLTCKARPESNRPRRGGGGGGKRFIPWC
jgi:hypothetical protein